MSCLAARAPKVRRLFAPSITRWGILCCVISCWSLLAVAYAQYPGRIDAKKAKPPVLRSIAVLEWVGEPGKPSASRIVPIAVFDGKAYQDGGIYMASPAPLAVEGDTEYQLLQAGVPQGNFDVFSAGEVGGFWYGYGVWKPIHEAPRSKLAASKTLSQIASDSDPQRPHFKGAGGGSDSSAGSNPKDDSGKDTSRPSDEDDKPTLKRRSGDSTTSPGIGTTQAPAPANAPGSSKNKSDDTVADPDRPRLRKRSTQPEAATPQEAVTAISNGDPDRPKLRRGQPAALMVADHLTGTPTNLQQMIAISDASYHEGHSYTFEWANPEDARKMQTALEQVAESALASKVPPAKNASVASRLATSRPPARAGAKREPVKSPLKSLAPQLVDQEFRALELAYSGGSTLVFTARTIDDGTPIRYVTVIAQPDFYGVPQVIFKQTTDANHLDTTPRLRLIDAVDTDGDNRAELVFEQRNKSDRQFAIYSVKSNRVEQVFATEALP